MAEKWQIKTDFVCKNASQSTVGVVGIMTVEDYAIVHTDIRMTWYSLLKNNVSEKNRVC